VHHNQLSWLDAASLNPAQTQAQCMLATEHSVVIVTGPGPEKYFLALQNVQFHTKGGFLSWEAPVV